jgi:hypothetical protein
MKKGWYRAIFTLVMVSILVLACLPAGSVVAQPVRFRTNWQVVIPAVRGEHNPVVKTPYGYTVVKPVRPTFNRRSRPKKGVLVVMSGPERTRQAQSLITHLAAVTTRRLADRLDQNVFNLNSIRPPRGSRGPAGSGWVPKAYLRLESVLAIKVSVKKGVTRLKPVLVWPHSGQTRPLKTTAVRGRGISRSHIDREVLMPALKIWRYTEQVWFNIQSRPPGQVVTYYYRSIKNRWGLTPVNKREPVYLDLGRSVRIEVLFDNGDCFYETIPIVKGMFPYVRLTFSRGDKNRPRCRSRRKSH